MEQERQAELRCTQDMITGGASELQTVINSHRSLTETIGQATTGVLKRAVMQLSALQERVESTGREQLEVLQRLQQQLDQYGEASHQEIEAVKLDIVNQLTDVKAAVVTVRNLALFLLVLLVIVIGFFSLLAVLMTRS